jgi:hypothetical protein
MRKLYIIILLLGFALLAGCGHLVGNNPEGVTGGHENGYGSGWGASSSGYYPDAALFGIWNRNDASDILETISFLQDGQYSYQRYENGSLASSGNGAFSVNGSSITIILDGAQRDGSFSINGDVLNLTIDGVTEVWTK